MNQRDLTDFFISIDGTDFDLSESVLRSFPSEYVAPHDRANAIKLADKGILTGDWRGYRISDEYAVKHGINRLERERNDLNKLYSTTRELVEYCRNNQRDTALWYWLDSRVSVHHTVYNNTIQLCPVTKNNRAIWQYCESLCQLVERAITRLEMGLSIERVG